VPKLSDEVAIEASRPLRAGDDRHVAMAAGAAGVAEPAPRAALDGRHLGELVDQDAVAGAAAREAHHALDEDVEVAGQVVLLER
jgi:hypothetical protein